MFALLITSHSSCRINLTTPCCLHLFTKKTTEIISALVTNDFDEDEGTISPDVRSPATERTAKTKANFNLPSVKDAPGDGDRPWTFEELRSSLCS